MSYIPEPVDWTTLSDPEILLGLMVRHTQLIAGIMELQKRNPNLPIFEGLAMMQSYFKSIEPALEAMRKNPPKPV